MQRTDLEFASGSAGDKCRAWFYEPDGGGPFATLVMGHGLGAVKEMRLDAYAERFAAAGYACLVFDYRHFGASDGEPRQLLDIDRQLEDWRAALACARGHERVRPDRVVLWGSSFGGGHVIATAGREPGVAAAIAQCPFTDGVASAMAMDWRSSSKVTARALRDRIGSWFGADPVMIPSAGPPCSAALMTAPDVESGYLRLVPPDSNFRNEVAARFGLQIITYRPGRSAGKVTCPILFCICASDSVAPAEPTRRYAAKAPRGEVRLYDQGHFDIYVGAAFEKVVADQLAFLQTHVPPVIAARHVVLTFLCDNLGAVASSWQKRLPCPIELWELDLARKGRFHQERAMKRALFAVFPAIFAMGCSGEPITTDPALDEASQNLELVQLPDDLYLPLDPCRTAEPDKLFFVLQNSAALTAESGSGAYGYKTTACKRWVVDYKVATYSPEWIMTGEAWDLPSSSVANGTWPSNAQDCGRVATYLTFYRKKANETAFTQMGSGKITGSWSASSSTCYRIPSGMTYVIAPHSASGWDTWRVAVGTKLRTTWQEVRATGQQYIEPPA